MRHKEKDQSKYLHTTINVPHVAPPYLNKVTVEYSLKRIRLRVNSHHGKDVPVDLLTLLILVLMI